MKEYISGILHESGAIAVGFARAGSIDIVAHEEFEKWIGEGCNGEMDYLSRHISLRMDTDNVLKGAHTVISLAFSYVPESWLPSDKPMKASYAYGEDYHFVLRERLKPVVKDFQTKFGGKWRICIDSAPVAERFWALKCGIGKRGINGSVIVEGGGSLCFLVEILTTLHIKEDSQSNEFCERCGACINECPSGALRGDGTIDARKCINYLTIEKRGEFNEEEREILSKGVGFLYGCDRCLRVCPHNRKETPTVMPEFQLFEKIKNLTPEILFEMSEDDFKKEFSRSALLYAGYERLRRNARLFL